MATGPGTLLLHHVRRLADAGAGQNDGELLRRFRRDGDGQAFAEIVRRHGPMVWAACRRILGRPHDAEDVFQATFLLLARKAAGLTRYDSLGGWLYGVAYRLALRARSAEARRRTREANVAPRPEHDPLAEITLREAQRHFDEALALLPDRLRAAVVLCHLEGLTRDEAARQLGCSLSTLKRALEDGRARLHDLLSRRGVTVPAGLLALLLTGDPASAVPAALTDSALRGALAARGTAPLVASKVGAVALVLAAFAGAAGLALAPRPLVSSAAQPVKPAEKLVQRLDDFGDPLPEGAVRRLGTLRFRPSGAVNRLIVAPDGKTLVSKNYAGDASVQVWELATGKLLHRLPGHFGDNRPGHFADNRAVALSPDGKTIAVGQEAHVHLYDLASGREVRRLRTPLRDTQAVAFSPDGKSLATSQRAKEIQLWDLATGTVRGQVSTRHHHSNLLAFSPDGETLAAGATGQQAITLFDVPSRKERHQVTLPGDAYDFAFAPAGTTLAVTTRLAGITFWDATTGKKVRTLFGDQYVVALAWSPDGKAMATTVSDEKAGSQYHVVFDPATGKELRRARGVHGHVRCLAFTPDGQTLVAAGVGGVIRRWDLTTGTDRTPAHGHQMNVWWLALSPDGKTLAYNDFRLVRLYDVAAGREVGTLPPLGRAAFSPDGKTLAGHDADDNISLYDVAERRRVGRVELASKDEAIRWASSEQVAFSPDGKTLAATGRGYRPGVSARFPLSVVRCWNLSTGKEIRRLSFQGATLELSLADWVAFSPDGRMVIASGRAGSLPGRVRLWDAATGREFAAVGAAIDDSLRAEQERKPSGPDLGALRAAVSPDSRLVACNTGTDAAFVWEALTGRVRCRLECGPTACVAFSADGRTLATAGYDGVIRLWDVDVAREVRQLTGHRGRANALAFTPDGKTLVSSGDDTTVIFWDVAAVTGRERSTGPLTAKQWDDSWDDLAADDGIKAHRAIARLSAAPDVAVPALKARLRPVLAADAARLAKLLRDLDADVFTTREKAARELREVGESATAAVERERSRAGASLELRRRLDEVMKHAWAAPVGEDLGALRAAEVLEKIGTPEARQVVESLAKGVPEARLTREATAALGRLAKRAASR